MELPHYWIVGQSKLCQLTYQKVAIKRYCNTGAVMNYRRDRNLFLKNRDH